jgi:hypothetical protein
MLDGDQFKARTCPSFKLAVTYTGDEAEGLRLCRSEAIAAKSCVGRNPARRDALMPWWRKAPPSPSICSDSCVPGPVRRRTVTRAILQASHTICRRSRPQQLDYIKRIQEDCLCRLGDVKADRGGWKRCRGVCAGRGTVEGQPKVGNGGSGLREARILGEQFYTDNARPWRL